MSLLEQQQAMGEKIVQLRDEAGDRLRQLQRQQRGNHTYLQAMG